MLAVPTWKGVIRRTEIRKSEGNSQRENGQQPSLWKAESRPNQSTSTTSWALVMCVNGIVYCSIERETICPFSSQNLWPKGTVSGPDGELMLSPRNSEAWARSNDWLTLWSITLAERLSGFLHTKRKGKIYLQIEVRLWQQHCYVFTNSYVIFLFLGTMQNIFQILMNVTEFWMWIGVLGS